MSKLKEKLKDRILIMDGAMGTMLQSYNLKEKDFRGSRFKNHSQDLKGNNDLLCITQPDIISEIHRAYFDSGADIIETNTFNSNKISQSDYGTEDLVYEINFKAASIAKSISKSYTDKPRFVAGAMGPTNRTATLSPDVNRPEFRNINLETIYRLKVNKKDYYRKDLLK